MQQPVLDEAFRRGVRACVEKVRQMEKDNREAYEYWKSIASNPETDFGVLKFVAWAGEDSRVITALESIEIPTAAEARDEDNAHDRKSN